jgi:di/tricarboxylate transporter
VSNQTIEKSPSLSQEIQQLIHSARDKAVRAVDFERVVLYWNIGKRIVEKEQTFKVFPIVNAVRSQLSWTQYKLIICIDRGA